MTFAPTPEQQNAVDLFLTGKDLVIEAGAGTGKTSTLVHIAKANPEKRMQYVAFNSAIVRESKAKMPENVSCNTMHSLAMREEGKKYRHRLDSGRMKSMQIARHLDVDDIQITVDGTAKKRLSAGYLASHVMRAIQSFCQSADPVPTRSHFPYIEGIDLPAADGRRRYDNNNAIAKALEPALARAWKDLTDVDGKLPYGHHCYLKSWQLGSPRIYADVILFDEAQDSSPVMADILAQQTRSQRVYVGDTQQQLYAWLGAVNALANIDGANRAWLTKSFRFGPEVAKRANLVLEWLDAELRITGNDALNSRVEETSTPNVILCRTNAKALEVVLQNIKAGKRVAIVGGAKELVDFAKAARDLQQKGWTSHRELACFDTWGEVEAYVANDPQGGELKLLVKLVTEYGPEVIIRHLDQTCDERAADITVSTAHKSKGREWDAVKLASDFPEPEDGASPETLDDGELRLLYVAVTRAQVVLDPFSVPMFFDAKPGRR